MATYIERTPGDVRRMIEEYSSREVMIEVDVNGWQGYHDIVITLPCSWTIPYNTGASDILAFLLGKTPELRNLDSKMPIIAWIDGRLVVVAGRRWGTLYRFTDRQTTLLLDKLARLHRDMIERRVQKIY